MEFSISTAEIRKAIGRAQGVADAKSTMPILSHVLLQAVKTPDGGMLSVQAYDLEQSVSATHPCVVSKEGAIALPAKALHNILKVVPEETVRFKVGASNRMEVTSGASSFRIAGMPSEDFPAVPAAPNTAFASVPLDKFAEAIGKVSFAMSSDDTRYNLNGVFVDRSAEGVTLVATDGHRLAKVSLEGVAAAADAKGVIVPRKGITELQALMEEQSEGLGEIAFTDSALHYRFAGVTFSSRLVDGSFPAYQQVVPKLVDSGLQVGRDALSKLLKRVMILSAAGSSVSVEVADNAFKVSARDPDVGEASDVLGVTYTGKPLKIALNGKYLSEMLSASIGETMEIHVEDDMSPVVLRPAADLAHVNVVMPMRN